MLDPKWVREHPDEVKEAGRKKRMDCAEVVDRFLEVDEALRALLPEVEGLRARQKSLGREMGKASPEEREALLQEQKEAKKRIQELGVRERELKKEREDLLLRMPNIPAPEVPEGVDDSDNVELRRVGEIPDFGFSPKDHITLGEKLGILDFKHAAELAGTRNYFLKGKAVLLEEAVLRFALDHLIAKGFEPMTVPLLVRDFAMVGTAYFPGGEEQAYRCEKDELNLIGTGEVPLTSFHQGEILSLKDLPIRLVARSVCFRREAGTYGKDTKGLYRVHQFQKVEQVILDVADPELSIQRHLEITTNSEELLQAMGLPYRVVNVCGGDLGQPQIQKFDIETWMPSRESYGETHSASRFHDFQTRRLKIRYKDEEGKTRYCYSLNNTVIASPRILIAILENYQEEDGSVTVPEVLRPYCGFDRIERR
ncbi:MAG TPA: serine--tRNA ligase [Planctomycetes bacterium]|nr:serine--tRNA ligase [Planctomycetota bacterium]